MINSTPRTDAMKYCYCLGVKYVRADDCQRLERELNSEKAKTGGSSLSMHIHTKEPIESISANGIEYVPRQKLEECVCKDFLRSQQRRTDNEEFGRLTRHHAREWFIGSGALASINFCPWCGKKVPEVNV